MRGAPGPACGSSPTRLALLPARSAWNPSPTISSSSNWRQPPATPAPTPNWKSPGPGGAWRADVLATAPTGAWKTALEAQLAPITNADITDRTEKMRADGVTSIWFSDRPRPPWLGTTPSVRLTTADTGQGLLVAEGLVKFDGRGWEPVPASLTDFLAWAFARRVVPHTPQTSLWYPQRALPTVWTAPHYITAETAHLEEEERQPHP
ncbi:hypothetical protein ACFV2X_22925 [Streptomyces sp. NPDC059679]|uniref:competence protein CoiA family protein n=1 Tax=Streptomyces sp. NPDC059679 TaxID=3346903 RepID=UPI00368F1290